MSEQKPLSAEFRINVALGIILSLVTCGIYNAYWNAVQFRAMNTLLGRQEFKFWTWALLSLITCGIFHIYYEYKMGQELEGYLRSTGNNTPGNFALIGLILSCVGLTIAADAIYQNELNRLIA